MHHRWLEWTAAAIMVAGAAAMGAGCVTGHIDEPPTEASTGAGNNASSGGSSNGGAGVGGSSSSNGGGGASGECDSAADCPGLDMACRVRSCTTGACGFEDVMAGATCTENGGRYCDGAGTCVDCLTNAHCQGGVCQANLCVPVTCTDGQLNGDETDTDCGGMCADCVNGDNCLMADDCISQFCNGGLCAPCTTAANCTSTQYCNGGVCTSKKMAGDVCQTSVECSSGFCPAGDGVCCNSACTGTCRACLMGKTGTPNGTCASVIAMTDPDTECPAQSASTCGSSGAGCNGSNNSPGCILWSQGTQCIGPSCMNGMQTTPGQCNGTGTCVPGMTSSCGAYVCSGSSCLTNCTMGGNADCAQGYTCSMGICVMQSGNGSPCTTPGQCQSGFCVDGVCCNNACTGLCRACDVSGSIGTCAYVLSNSDPDNECPSTQVCNGSGACMAPCQGAGPMTTPLDSEEQTLLMLINNHRANNSRPPLSACTSLNRAAQGHSEDMRDNDYFSHTGLNNSTFTQRCCLACYSLACPSPPLTAMGENIAAGYSDAASTFNQWLNSPPHNANMLSLSYTRIGIGRATGGGMYGTYWTNDFGGATEPSCN